MGRPETWTAVIFPSGEAAKMTTSPVPESVRSKEVAPQG